MRSRSGRKPLGKNVRKNIYIFTEGYTEKNYFKMISKKYNSSMNVKVTVKPTGFQGTNLLNFAKKSISGLSAQEKKNLESVYIIFDRDDLSHENIEQTISNARKSEIKIGYSNICFELWLVSHFESINSFTDRNKLYQKLETYLDCTQYERIHKADYNLVCNFEDYISNAILNCNELPDLNQTMINTNPYTNIGKIIQDIYKQDIY